MENKAHNWEKIGAVAGIFGAVAAIIALFPMVSGALRDGDHRKLFEGPIAQIAITERGYDSQGFSQHDATTMADIVTYRYSGHYKDKAGTDTNPENKICKLTLHANPPASHPYGGESGFVYVQAGTSSHPERAILYNPTVDEIYRKKLEFKEYVAPECWPGNYSFTTIAR